MSDDRYILVVADNSEEMNWELPTGIIILTGTYFFDTILYPRLNKK